MTYKQLKERIEELKRQREQLMTQANLALAKITGAIEEREAELAELAQEMTKEDELDED